MLAAPVVIVEVHDILAVAVLPGPSGMSATDARRFTMAQPEFVPIRARFADCILVSFHFLVPSTLSPVPAQRHVVYRGVAPYTAYP